mmetsp:Transcript_6627/g.14441  ORF Transcript_6627/g.14441 Transcript_6627/m.14441 type:complete len:525 (+) Transcript_6627:66-1640(+)
MQAGEAAEGDDEISGLLTALTRQPSVSSRGTSSESCLPQDGAAEGGAAASGDADYDEKLRQWQQRRKARAKTKRNSTEGGSSYGDVVKCAIASNATMDGLEETMRRRGLLLKNLKMLAQGSFAHVYTALWFNQGTKAEQEVAVKVMRGAAAAAGKMPRWLQREIEVQQSQQHPHLVSVCEASLDSDPYVMVLEYCAGGTLQEALQTVKLLPPGAKPQLSRLSWAQRTKIAKDVASGMLHLHSQRLVHRDLKTQNILLLRSIESLADEPHAKVGDFGMARVVEEQGKTTGVMTSTVGSWIYMAPEIMMSGTYDEKVDVWSFAMVVYEIITEILPFTNTPGAKNANSVKLGLHLLRGLRPTASAIREDSPQDLVNLMGECWAGDAAQRPSFNDVFEQLSLEYDKAIGKAPKEADDDVDLDLGRPHWLRLSSCHAQPTLPSMLEEEQSVGYDSQGRSAFDSEATNAGDGGLPKTPLAQAHVPLMSPSIELPSAADVRSESTRRLSCFSGCGDCLGKLVSNRRQTSCD